MILYTDNIRVPIIEKKGQSDPESNKTNTMDGFKEALIQHVFNFVQNITSIWGSSGHSSPKVTNQFCVSFVQNGKYFTIYCFARLVFKSSSHHHST